MCRSRHTRSTRQAQLRPHLRGQSDAADRLHLEGGFPDAGGNDPGAVRSGHGFFGGPLAGAGSDLLDPREWLGRRARIDREAVEADEFALSSRFAAHTFTARPVSPPGPFCFFIVWNHLCVGNNATRVNQKPYNDYPEITNTSIMKFLLILAFLSLSVIHSYAQPSPSAAFPKVAAETRETRAAAFEQVWKTVNEKHYDPTFGGVDWKRVREIYEPKATAAVSDKDFHDVLRQMLGELKLSHFGIHPPTAEMVAAQTGRGVTGIDVLVLDGVPVINRVDAGSPAARAGVKTGQAIVRIDGRPWSEVVAQLQKTLAARKVTEGMRLVYLERTLE